MTTQHHDTPQFYLTAPTPCPYLPDQQERKVFIHLMGQRAEDLHEILAQGGFRRSQTIAYRPACENCLSCISVRVIASDFWPNYSFKRVIKQNEDLISTMTLPEATSEQYFLFHDYIHARHSEGGMANMDMLDYSAMVEASHVTTRVIEYRHENSELIAVALLDILSDGLSMVYSFYDPEQAHRSLGTYLILDTIARAQALGLPYVYLGYWIAGSKSMHYKSRFYPQERLLPEGWVRFNK